MSENPLPPSFRRLAWSNLAAQSAEQIGLAAAPIVAVLALGAGAGETGQQQTAQTQPFILFAIPAGVLADRTSRARLMASAEVVRVLSLAAIVAFLLLGGLTLPWLAVLGFAGAAGTVAYSVAAPALVPSLVPAGGLVAANGRLELARTVAFTAGPALAGALVGWTGGASAFALATALSMGAVVLLAGLAEPARTAAPSSHPLAEVREGAAFVFGHRLLRPVYVTQFVFNVAFFVLQAVYVPYAVQRLALSASEIGMTLATYGAGMVVGALLATRIVRALPFGAVVALGPVIGFVASVVMALTLWAPSALLAALSFFLIGAGPIVWVISTATLRQRVTPRALLGRVSAITLTSYGARPLGAAIGAAVGALYGVELCLLLAAAGFLAQMLVIVTSPVARLTTQPDPAG
jgi:predicted MFS family arabinose efflux permease